MLRGNNINLLRQKHRNPVQMTHIGQHEIVNTIATRQENENTMLFQNLVKVQLNSSEVNAYQQHGLTKTEKPRNESKTLTKNTTSEQEQSNKKLMNQFQRIQVRDIHPNINPSALNQDSKARDIEQTQNTQIAEQVVNSLTTNQKEEDNHQPNRGEKPVSDSEQNSEISVMWQSPLKVADFKIQHLQNEVSMSPRNQKQPQTEQLVVKSHEKKNSFLYYKQKLNQYQAQNENPQLYQRTEDILKPPRHINKAVAKPDWQSPIKYSQSPKRSLLNKSPQDIVKKSNKSLRNEERKNKKQLAEEMLNSNIAFLRQLKQNKSGKLSLNIHQWCQEPKRQRLSSFGQNYEGSARKTGKKRMEQLGFSVSKKNIPKMGYLNGNNPQSMVLANASSSVQLPKIKSRKMEKRQWRLEKPIAFNIYNINHRQHEMFYNPK